MRPGHLDSDRSDGLSGKVAEALAALTQRDREALMLIAWEGLPPKEAARVLGELPSTFHVRLHRAKRRFKRLREQHEIEGVEERSSQALQAKETIPYQSEITQRRATHPADSRRPTARS